MTYPLRLRVMVGLTNLLKTITPANGYVTDMSDFPDLTLDPETGEPVPGAMMSRVYRGRNVFGDNDQVPMLSILENPHTEPTMHTTPRGAVEVIGPWEVLIQGFGIDDPLNPSDPAHVMMADVKQCLITARRDNIGGGNLAPNLFGCGAAVDDIVIGSGVVRPPDEISAKCYFWLMMTIELSENLQTPYA